MIPQSKLTRTDFSHAIGNRVEACRKRLRTVRCNTGELQLRLEEVASELGFEVAGLNRETTTMSLSMMESQGRDEAGIT